MSFLYLVFCVLRLGGVGKVGRARKAEIAGCSAITLAILLLCGCCRAPPDALLHTKLHAKLHNKQCTTLW